MYHAGVRKYKKRFGGARRAYGGKRKLRSVLSPEVCGAASPLVVGPVGSAAHARVSHDATGLTSLSFNSVKCPIPDKYFCVLRGAWDSINCSAFRVTAQQAPTTGSYLIGNNPYDPGKPGTYTATVFVDSADPVKFYDVLAPLYVYNLARSSRLRLAFYNDGSTPYKVVVFPTNIVPDLYDQYIPNNFAAFTTWAQKCFYHTVPSQGQGGHSTMQCFATYTDVVGEPDDISGSSGNIGTYPNQVSGTAGEPGQKWYWVITAWHFDGTPINPEQNDFYCRATIDYYMESWCPLGQVSVVVPPGPHTPTEDFEDMALEAVRLIYPIRYIYAYVGFGGFRRYNTAAPRFGRPGRSSLFCHPGHFGACLFKRSFGY